MILNAVEAGDDLGPPLVLLHGLFGAARNFGAVQRALSARRRVIALDLRNHGDSPHATEMSYAVMAADVMETLAAKGVLPCVLLGHSMGGKCAMTLALARPDAVAALIVSDIAPVAYPPTFEVFAAAMRAVILADGLTRAEAGIALAGVVPDAGVRAFLLQNLRLGRPSWRIGLDEIAAALPEIGGWSAPMDGLYEGPAVFIAGARSDYIRPEHRGPIRALFPAARFVTIKDAGHWVHADSPSGFVSVVEGILAQG